MIGKQTKGKSFRGVLNYLHEKEGSRLIGGNMAGETPRVMAAEFAVSRQLNPRLEKAVYHSSLSLPKTEQLDDEQWNAIADDYIQGMGFEGSQYVVYRHSDKDHDHIHIVASRIRITDGTTVNDSWDYVRSEKLIRELEEKYELTPTISSNQKYQRGQTSGERRLIERTGEESVRSKLQQTIDAETVEPITMPELISRLKHRGVDARVSYTRTGKVKGISYSLEGVAFSGTHLGKAYTFPGLQRHKGVSYELEMDSQIQIVSAREPEVEARETVVNREGQPDKELEAKKRRYRAQYEQVKSWIEERLGDRRTSIEEIDVKIGMFLMKSVKDVSEALNIIVQSDKVYELKAALPESEYRQKALEYVREIWNRALEKEREREELRQRQQQKQRERGFELEL